MIRLIRLLLFSALLAAVFSAAGPTKTIPKKSKLCGDEKCSEVLFTVKVDNVISVDHGAFLSGHAKGDDIDIVAFKFSDRTDIFEAQAKDGRRGLIFANTFSKVPYSEFLKSAIVNKKEIVVVSQDNNDIGDKRVIGSLHADRDLIRDYNAAARNAAIETGHPAPVELPIPAPPQTGHGHSHGGHGHSHGGHGHSHGGDAHAHSHDAHGHSHEAPVVATPQQPAAPVVNQQPPSAGTPVAGLPVENALPPQAAAQQAVPMAAIPPPVSVEQQAAVPSPIPNESATPTPSAVQTNLPDQQSLDENSILPSSEQNMAVEDPDSEIQRMLERDLELMQQMKGGEPTKHNIPPLAHAPMDPNPSTPTPAAPTTEVPLPLVDSPPKEAADEKVAEPVVKQRLSSLDILGKRLAENSKEEVKPEIAATPELSHVVHATPIPNTPEQPLPGNEASQQPLEVTTPPATAVETPVEMPSITTPPPVQPKEITATSPLPEATIPTTTPASTPTEHTFEAPPLPPLQEPSVEGYCDGDDCKKIKPLDETTPEPLPDEPAPWATQAPAAETTMAPSAASQQVPPDPTTTPSPVDNKPAAPPVPLEPAQDFLDMEALSRSQPPSSPGFLGGIVRWLCGAVRAVVPGMGDLSDGGVGIVLNITIFVLALTIRFVGSLLGESDSEQFERKAAHDLASRCKALQTQLNERNAKLHEAQRSASNGAADAQAVHKLQAEIYELNVANEKLHAGLTASQSDLKRETEHRQALEAELGDERKAVARLMHEAEEAGKRALTASSEQKKGEKELVATKEALDRFEKELREALRDKEHAEKQLEKSTTRAKDLTGALETAREEARTASQARDDYESQMVTLHEMVSELQTRLDTENAQQTVKPEENGADAGSAEDVPDSNGGSGGWSDIGDFNDDDNTAPPVVAATVPRPAAAVSSVGDIQEVARLRGEIKRLESKVETMKKDLENEELLKKSLEKTVSRLEDEVLSKRRELEERENERRRANEHSDKLLHMVEEANAKARETEVTCGKLRDEIRKLQDEARVLDDDRRKKEEKLKETDNELKKLRNDYYKLDAKHFNLTREHKAMQDQQALAHGPGELLSGLGPSDTEQRAAAGSRGAGLLSGYPYEPLWDEPPLLPHRMRTTSPDDFVSGAMPQLRRNSRSRRSERREPSPSDHERRRTPKEGVAHRRRSRSQGRHPFSTGYHDFPMLSSNAPRPLLPNRPGSHIGGSIGLGGHVYYSSGGSNSGRSPPPELPAQSAVPPAGLHKPKGTRAVDLNAAFK